MAGKMALTASVAHLNPVSSGWTAESLLGSGIMSASLQTTTA